MLEFSCRYRSGRHPVVRGQFAARDRKLDTDTSGLQIEQGQRLIAAIELLKPASRIRQAHAFKEKPFRCVVQRAGQVSDFEKQAVSVLKRPDGDNVPFSRFPDAVPNGILDKRLQNQSRNRAASDIRLNLKFKSNAIAKTSSLNSDIVFDELKFAGERDFVRMHLVQRDTQQFAEAQEDIFGSVGILVDQRRSGLKPIEQEMRMQLGSQILDLSLCQACF
jgi:hypothetical protein